MWRVDGPEIIRQNYRMTDRGHSVIRGGGLSVCSNADGSPLTLRRWLADVLTASRYCQSLERMLQEQRQDFTVRLAEKDTRIRELKTDLAGLKLESDRMRLVLMPLGSPAGQMYADRFQGQHAPPPVVPEFAGPLDWNAELQQMLDKEMADGTCGERRISEHKPGSNEAARAFPDGEEV